MSSTSNDNDICILKLFIKYIKSATSFPFLVTISQIACSKPTLRVLGYCPLACINTRLSAKKRK